MSEWICKEPESCFKCPFRDCIKHVKDRRCKPKKGSTIIASFPNKTVKYFQGNEIEKLAEILRTTLENVLNAVNGDGWYNGTFMVWGEKPKILTPERQLKRKIKKLVAYWADGRKREFESISLACNYLHMSRETLRRKMKYRTVHRGVMVLELGEPAPTEDEFYAYKAGIDKESDIPVPERQADDTFKYLVTFDDGSVNEYYSLADLYRYMRPYWNFTQKTFMKHYHSGDKLVGVRDITTSGSSICQPLHHTRKVCCRWQNGETRIYRTATKAAECLCISASTVLRYLGTNESYRGVLFEEVAG